MAFTPPTADQLQVRFPPFAGVADAIVDIALTEAALMVDDSWNSQEDFTQGRLLYAAHTLVIEGHGTGAEAKLGKSGTLGFQTIQSGKLRLTRGDSASAKDIMMSTTYGKRFRDLLARNRSGPLVVSDRV